MEDGFEATGEGGVKGGREDAGIGWKEVKAAAE